MTVLNNKFLDLHKLISKMDEMSKACSTHGRYDKYIGPKQG
jgi:hypothetical protein